MRLHWHPDTYLPPREKNMATIISKRGDVNAADHGGGGIVRDKYGYHLEWTHGLEDDHPGEEGFGDEVADLELKLYRVPLDETAWVKLSTCGNEVELWEGIADSCDMDLDEVVKLAKSDKKADIATALELFAGIHGWINLDGYPLSVRYAEIEDRWEKKSRKS